MEKSAKSIKQTAAMLLRWKNPEYRKMMAALNRDRWADPVFRERATEAQRQRWRTTTIPHHALGIEKPGIPKATLPPTVLDLAWAAGFLEGEGTFINAHRHLRYAQTQVSAVQVNPDPLHRLAGLFGGKVRAVKRRNRLAAWKPTLVWAITGPRARGVAMTMYALMTDKRRKQIRAALGVA